MLLRARTSGMGTVTRLSKRPGRTNALEITITLVLQNTASFFRTVTKIVNSGKVEILVFINHLLVKNFREICGANDDDTFSFIKTKKNPNIIYLIQVRSLRNTLKN